MNLFGNRHEFYKGYIQKDCIEFTFLLIDDLSKEFNLIRNIPVYSAIHYRNPSSKFDCEEGFNDYYYVREKPFIQIYLIQKY